MQNIPDGSIDAIITDPPYGTTACKWDSVIDFKLMWEQLNRIIKPNGAIVLFGSEPFSSALRMSNIKNYKYDWIWEKEQGTNFQHAKRMPLKKHEIVSVFYKKANKYYPQGLKFINKNKKGKTNNFGESSKHLNKPHIQKYSNYPKSIIYYSKDVNRVHPTQKPVALMEYLIKTYTNEGETVLDFTMGSGSTGVAAKNTNRNFIGIEMDDKYFGIAQNRINGVIA
jgi:site-specific DNA-methyltransferase (adenine-specific)